MICPNIESPKWKALVDKIGENNAYIEFLKYRDIPEASHYNDKGDYIFRSIKTKSTEEIASGLDLSLTRNQIELKYTKFIQAGLLNTLGDISPNKQLEISPAKAFASVKEIYKDVADSLNLALTAFVKSDEDLAAIKASKDFEEIAKEMPVLRHVNSYTELANALTTYDNLIKDFDKYRDYVVADLAGKGIKITDNKIEQINPEDKNDKEQDETEDNQLGNHEINSDRFDKSVFETNPRDTASLRVKALVQTIKSGQYEFGIPIYADPNDVFTDILYAGSTIKLTGFTDTDSKFNAFKTALLFRKESRPYLDDLLTKLNTFEQNGEWDKINDVLTFATKAFANETLVLFKTQRSGEDLLGIKEVKVINSNRDTIEEQVSRDWLTKHMGSDFFTKSATGELKPKAEKLEQLKTIIAEGQEAKGIDKVKKFQEFFNVLGINLTDKEMEYIAPRIANAIKKNTRFEGLFKANNMLQNIYNEYEANKDVVFEGQYGVNNQKSSMHKLANLYFEANPGMYNITSSTTADGKNKYLYTPPSYSENKKREFETGDTTGLDNSPLAAPNKEGFWTAVKNKVKTFRLGYFNGMREQEAGKDGKVRKNLTSKEQHATMLLKHQAEMGTGTYVSFTLSDKTTSIETKITKEFFADEESAVMGKGVDFSIEDGRVKFTDGLKDKVYNTFVEPEVSRMLVAMKNMDSINLENFKVASRLFYIVPSVNTDPRLAEFRNAITADASLEDLKKFSTIIGEVVLDNVYKSAQQQFTDYVANNTITEKTAKNGEKYYTYPMFYTKYVNRFKQTGIAGKRLGLLMLIDMKLNYMNAQVKTVQFLRFDPMLAFKGKVSGEFETLTDDQKLGYINATWDEFSKRAAALIAPGGQGNWNWKYNGNKEYNSNSYNAVTVSDVVKIVGKTKNETTDAQEFVTMQEHIDHLMSEGKIPQATWESIHNKIVNAKPGGYYELTSEELKYVFTPVKPVAVNDVNEAAGLNRIDYVKSSRFPLIPQHEVGSDRDKVRVWMEKNNVQSLNFASAKKLGRPSSALSLFNEKGEFVEPSKESFDGNMQVLSRDGLRTQQEMPHQKSHIATVSQMNRTLFDGLLESKFTVGGLKDISGREAKALKEAVRSKLFDNANDDLQRRLGNVSKSHQGLYELLKDVILNDTTGSYGDNDLRSIELDPTTNKFKIGLEFQFKNKKFQGLINSLVNKNVMLKVDGASFVQVSGVGAKYTLSDLSNGVKSDIIWIDKHVEGKKEVSLDYIRKDESGVTPAQVLVSQYIRDEKGNLIDLSQFVTEKDGVKILDTSKFDADLLQLVASRIPNQSHPSTLPIEVVGFLPGYMENSIVVPDGITGQMGSDFDVDKLFAYLSKVNISRNEDGNITHVGKVKYELNSASDVNNLNQEQLEQLYRDIHWSVLTNAATYDKITGSVDMPELKNVVAAREQELSKYGITQEAGINLPLDYGTSIRRFNDNRSAKDGVGIFATNISAQADFQDKVLTLGFMQDGQEIMNPVQIRLKKGGETVDLLHIGQTAKSVSKIAGKTTERAISDNLNMMFSESVDNVKNQMLKQFNWDKKAMGPIGALVMLSTDSKEAAPITFATGLTSQNIMYQLFERVDNKQDSFGKFDPDAMTSSILELQAEIAKTIDDKQLLDDGTTGFDYITDKKRDDVLDPDTLADMWTVGQILKQSEDKQEELLANVAKDLGYPNTKQLLLAYYGVQNDVLSLFSRLDGISREMTTIFGSVYPYTQGIGPSVFHVKQKINQLNKLSASTTFLGIKDVAGQITKSPQGVVSIDPKGEIGSAIANSYMVAQDLYQSIFPISTGATLEGIVNKLLQNQGINSKDEIGKEKYVNLHNSVFEGIKSFLYTSYSLELFDNPVETRNRLINGDSSIGKRVQNYKETSTELAKNGFLKNIEVKPQYKGDAYTVSFKAPFGTDIDERAVITGFYELATSADESVRELARDLALYPFATGDGGNIGRFIPIDYYMSDVDFKKAIGILNATYIKAVANDDIVLNTLIDQIVQNNPEEYSKSVKFSTFNGTSGKKDNTFKKILKPLIGNAENLSEVSKFTITVGDIKKVDGSKGIEKSFRVPATDEEIAAAPSDIETDGFKYSPYILITDSYSDNTIDGQDRTRNYLYKRTSEAITKDGKATYERINILGYNTIKEYDINNPNLVSAIKDNNVPENFTTDVAEEAPEVVEPQPVKTEELVKQKVGDTEPVKTEKTTPRFKVSGNEVVYTEDGSTAQEYDSPEAAKEGLKKWLGFDNKPTSSKPELLNKVGDTITQLTPARYKTVELKGVVEEIVATEKGQEVTLRFKTYNGSKTEKVIIENGEVVKTIYKNPLKLGEYIENNKATYNFAFSNTTVNAEQSTVGSEYTNHSGGAVGSDSAWGKIGEKYGIKSNHYYHGTKTPYGNVEITDEELEEGWKHVQEANKVLNRKPNNYKSLLSRNWLQVKNSSEIFAIIEGFDDNKNVRGGTGWAVQMALDANKPVHVFNQKEGKWYVNSNEGWKETGIPKLTTDFAGIGTRDLTPTGQQAIRDVYENTFGKPKTGSVNVNKEEEVAPEKPSTVVEYGAKSLKYIIEGTDEEGDLKVFATNAEGLKGQEIKDPNLISKISLVDKVNRDPENVVTLKMKGSPKYYVTPNGEVLSLQPSSYGNQITSNDVVQRVMSELVKKIEIEGPNPESDFKAAKNIPDGNKTIRVPEGSKSTNNVIFEDANNIYLMNDGQQKAYDFIKGQVETLLKNRKQISVSDLDSTVSFADPLTQKFNGLIPTEMWNNMIGLAGRGGVGKTTVIKAIMDSIDTGNKYSKAHVMYLTPSHTAATVLQESLGLDSEKANDGMVNTIAAATRRNQTVPGSSDLAMMSEFDYLKTCKFKPAFGSPDILIIDESSMVSQQNIKDMITRLKTDLAQGRISRMPVFIFMGDYRQLGPIKEEQNKFVNKGVISSTLLLDKTKTRELNQVMRSGNKMLHQIYDSIGEGIIDNIDRTKNGLTPERLSFDDYDKLTKESSENILVVTNTGGVIDDYADYLSKNNNPYGMFWVHYNQVDNAKTKNLAAAIRQAYFNKAGLKLDNGTSYRNFTIGDYIEYTAGLETQTDVIKKFNTTNPETIKLLEAQKDISKNNDGSYAILGGVIKPRARMKVLDIQQTKQPLSNYLPSLLERMISSSNREVVVEQMLIYNRQDRVRAVNKVLGLSVNMGAYNNISKRQEGITITDKATGEQIAKFSLNYGDFKKVDDALRTINEGGSMPFTPSYIGSSHTAQGNSIKNVIVGDYNIREALANGVTNQDDVFSSMYVGLTRTSGTLTIIKPAGMNITNNQDVYKGALTDSNERLPIGNGETSPSVIAALETPAADPGKQQVIPLDEYFTRAALDRDTELLTHTIFGKEGVTSNYKGVLNTIFKTSDNEFTKEFLKLLGSSSAMTPVIFKIDTTIADPGHYNPGTKTISINPRLAIGGEFTNLTDARASIHEVILHELVHHVTVDMLKAKPEDLNVEQRKFVLAFNNLFRSLQEKFLQDPQHSEKLMNAIDQTRKENGFLSAADKSLYYGLTNVYDFASMLISDKNFQEFMNNTEYAGPKSVLDRFIELLNNLFKALGFNVKDESALKEGLSNIVGMIKTQPEGGEVFKSVATKSAKQILIEDNFNDIIKSLGIKTEC